MTQCRLPADAVHAQATRLLEATVRKVGTDEIATVSVACGIKKMDCVAELDRSLGALMSTEELQRYNDGIPSKTGRVISRIFQDELSGTDLSHARDCLELGRITHRDGRFEYFRDGVLDFFDLSSTDAKIGTAAVVGGLALLCLLSPPAAITAAAALMVGASVISGAAILKNGVEIMTQTDLDGRDDWRDLGHAAAGFVAATAPLPKVLPILRETWVPSVGPAMPFGGPCHYRSPLTPPPTAAKPTAVELPQPAGVAVTEATPPPLKTTAAAFFTSSNGETSFYKIKIHWRNGKTSAFFWDKSDNSLLQIQGEHIIEPLPGMSTLVPELAVKIIDRKPIPYVDEIRSIEVLEFNQFGAAQFRAARGNTPAIPPVIDEAN